MTVPSRAETEPSPDPQRNWLHAAASAASSDEGQAQWERENEPRRKPPAETASARRPLETHQLRVSSPLGQPQRQPVDQGDEALVLEPSRHQQVREAPPGRTRIQATTSAVDSPSRGQARAGGMVEGSAERLVLEDDPAMLQRRPYSPGGPPPLGRLPSSSFEGGGSRSGVNSPTVGRPPRAKTLTRGDADGEVLVLGGLAPSSPSLNSSLGSRTSGSRPHSRLAQVPTLIHVGVHNLIFAPSLLFSPCPTLQVPVEAEEGSMGRSSPARVPSPRVSSQTARGPSPIGSVGAGSSTGAGSEGTGNNWLEDDWDSSDDEEGDGRQRGGTVRQDDGGKRGLGSEATRPSSSMKQDALGNGSADGVKQSDHHASTARGLEPVTVNDGESDGDASDDNWDSDGDSEAESMKKSQPRGQLKPQPKATVPASPIERHQSSQSSITAGFSDMRLRRGDKEEGHKEIKHDAFVEEDWDDDSS